MYIRFVVPAKDEDSGREMGLFTAGGILAEEGQLYDYQLEQREQLLAWFSNNLAVPHVQAAKSNYYARPQAISWFKASATEHIARMREYAEILKSHDLEVSQLTTERPGKIVYEDAYQIAAIPFKDTFLSGS